MDLRDQLRYDGSRWDSRETPGCSSKSRARKDLEDLGPELAELQEKLFANGKLGDPRRVLLVLQGRDASGKDGTVKHVVGLVNPAGCRITGFGKPTKEELAHDFLWRITNALPGPGQLGVFNRSHYEDVLVVRVHELVPQAVWGRRFARINAWEKRLVAQGTTVVKVFLDISEQEQRERLLVRLDDPTKHWKVGTADIGEHRRYDDYTTAYDDVLAKTSTDVAPWYVVPGDRKWYRDWAVSQLLVQALRDLDQGWPTPEGLDLEAMRTELAGS